LNTVPTVSRKRNKVRSIGLILIIALLLALFLSACSSPIAPSDDTPAATEESAEEESSGESAATPQPEEEASEEVASEEAESGGDAVSVSELAPAERNEYYDAPPEMTIDPEAYYYATIQTEKGDIKLQLFADQAPKTVNSFVYLANEGFYNDTTFHRVIDGFMAQAGDPTGTGMGGPGYQFEDEIVPGLGFDRPGLLAMANSGPGTNGSQFFITFAPTDWLNGGHTIFGEVIEGNEILNEITRRDPMADSGTDGDLIKAIVIEEGTESLLPTPTPLPPTPTPFPPSSLNADERPLAEVEPAERVNYFNTEPEMIIDPTQKHTATIATSQGDLVIELHADKAPIAVNNFVTLANLGFYDGLSVNQIIPDQVVIIGSPDNNPVNDAGYQIDAEVGLDVTPDKGSIAYIPIQNSPSEPIRSSSSQLLIALISPPIESNASFSFFGQAVEGEDVLDLLTEDDVIESITIEIE